MYFSFSLGLWDILVIVPRTRKSLATCGRICIRIIYGGRNSCGPTITLDPAPPPPPRHSARNNLENCFRSIAREDFLLGKVMYLKDEALDIESLL